MNKAVSAPFRSAKGWGGVLKASAGGRGDKVLSKEMSVVLDEFSTAGCGAVTDSYPQPPVVCSQSSPQNKELRRCRVTSV